MLMKFGSLMSKGKKSILAEAGENDGLIVEHGTLIAGVPQARRIIEAWRIDYNGERPHTSLNRPTPSEFAMRSIADHNLNGVYL